MIVSKQMLNAIRGVLRRELVKAETSVRENEKNLNYISKLLNSSISVAHRIEIINAINKMANTSFTLFSSNEIIINFFQNSIDIRKSFANKIRYLMSSFNKDGLNVVTYSLPIFCSLITNDTLLLKYLALMGIKYNGTHDKSGILMDELENNLYEFEIKMAELIQDDYTVESKDIDDFIRIYSEYIIFFYNYNSKSIKINEESIKSIIENMRYYLIHNISFANEIKKQQLEAEQEKSLIKPFQNREINQSPKEMDFEKESLLIQKELLKKEKEELYHRKKAKFEEIATPEELDIYYQAKISGNPQVTQIIKDIEAIISLLINENNEEEISELIDECKQLFNIIKRLLDKSDNINAVNNEFYKLYYSTNNYDDPTKCWFIKDLKDVREESLNNILRYLEELKLGISNKLKKLNGLHGYSEIKDDQVRIIFRPLENDKVIVLGVFIKKDNNDRETYNKILERSTELCSEEYSKDVEEYFKKYVEENARKGTRK